MKQVFYILSQNREKLYNMNGHIEGLGYEETYDYRHTAKGKKREETARHTLQVFDGCAEEVAEYATKEDCLQVLRMCAFAISNSADNNAVYELPTQEQLPELMKVYEQLSGLYKHAAGEVSEGLKELFDVLQDGGGI